MAIMVSFNRDGLEIIFTTELMEMGMTYSEMQDIADTMYNYLLARDYYDGDCPNQKPVRPDRWIIVSVEQGET